MAEPTQYMFTHKEVAEILVKRQDIHEGLWALSVEFGLNAMIAGPNDDQMFPTAMIPIIRIGIRQADKLTSVSVDAALVNPASKPKRPSKIIKKT